MIKGVTMGRRRRAPAPPIAGWIVVDKPAGITSTTVCNRIRRLAGDPKTGHGGTLDPLATGVLPIALGEATKTVSYAMDGEKSYRFRLRWGAATETDDAEGAVTETSDVRPSEEQIRDALPRFIGLIQQVPPIYSAIKIAGRRAYDLARDGQAFELEARPTLIHDFRLVSIVDRDHADFEVDCGKGSYMRSLARDLALATGTVGHIADLRRTRVGPFTEAGAIPLASLEALGHIAPDCEYLLPVETALADIPALAVSGSEAASLRQGQAVSLFRTTDLGRIGDLADGATVRATIDGTTVALARIEAGRVQPVRVINP